jgi:hypothetical protein
MGIKTALERYQDAEIAAVHVTLSRLTGKLDGLEEDRDFATVGEQLASLEMMLDARGWTEVYDYNDTHGLSLLQVKKASQQLRELVIANPFVQNGSRIRNAAIWGGGLDFTAISRTARTVDGERVPAGSPIDIPVRIQNLMEEPRNLRYVFGNDAHEELERGAFTDGNVFLLGEDATGKMQQVSIGEIDADMRNPNDSGEILAYRRTWYQNPMADGDDKAKQRITRWYYTDLTPLDQRLRSIAHLGSADPVETGYTMLDLQFNRQVGWAYGVPDALAIVAWARLYREFLVNGYVMSRSLAKIAYRVTVSSANGGKNAATSVALPGQAGSTAVQGSGNTLETMSSAGKGYDFGSGSPLAAAMAAGLGISLLSLTANPATATGSAAAAATLGPVERATAVMRRKSWDDKWVRIFRWMGLTSRLRTVWSDIKDEQTQRLLQALTLVDGLEVIDGQHMQNLVAGALSIADPGPVPEGWKPKSKRPAGRAPDSVAGNGGATDGTGQGADDGTGDSGNANRDDTDQ